MHAHAHDQLLFGIIYAITSNINAHTNRIVCIILFCSYSIHSSLQISQQSPSRITRRSCVSLHHRHFPSKRRRRRHRAASYRFFPSPRPPPRLCISFLEISNNCCRSMSPRRYIGTSHKAMRHSVLALHHLFNASAPAIVPIPLHSVVCPLLPRSGK
jgi:hypothetical protein